MLTSPARLVTYSVLGLRKGGLAGRYLSILLTFFLSGVLHMCGSSAYGIPWHESGAVRYFCMQALGIVIEDAVQAGYIAITGSDDRRQGGRPSLWKRFLGYIWVACFQAWSMPVYWYAGARRDGGEGMLPVEIIDKEYFRLWLKHFLVC